MILSERAAVTPRVFWPETGDPVPIDEVFSCTEGEPAGAIEIVGDSGSGKTTALRHLAAVRPPDKDIAWLDDAHANDVVWSMAERWVIYTARLSDPSIAAHRFQLAGWDEDDGIEYLLAAHPAQCRSVMAHLGAARDRAMVGQSPLLWRIVLDEMADDPSVGTVDAALRRRLLSVFPKEENARVAEEYCFAGVTRDDVRSQGAFHDLERECTPEGLRLLRAPLIQLLLAASCLAAWLENSDGRTVASLAANKTTAGRFPLRLPSVLLVKTAELVAASPAAIARLREILSMRDPGLQSMAASILHASGTGWVPKRGSKLCLNDAYLERGVAGDRFEPGGHESGRSEQ